MNASVLISMAGRRQVRTNGMSETVKGTETSYILGLNNTAFWCYD